MAALTRLRGVVRPPGDKSISHRALMLSALARGKSHITGLLTSADIESTAGVLRELGADIPMLSPSVTVTGQGARFLRTPAEPLDCGNSGTTARLMAGVIAGSGLSATFVGDASLSRRPMRRVSEPLRAMGARVELPAHGGLPMVVEGAPLQTIDWNSPVASAQIKSAILFAAVLGGVGVTVREPHLSRDHTERMLAARGVELRRLDDTTVVLAPGQVLHPMDVAVPADPSSAAFWAALGVMADEGELALDDVCLNPTRTGFFDVLRRMGGDLRFDNRRDAGGEPVGRIVVRASTLRAVTIQAAEVPSLIDELPLFACVAARAQGTSVVRGAAELRVKESDRIATVVANLKALGVNAAELEDGFTVEGGAATLEGRVETHGDHRIAMAFGVLGAVGGNQVELDDPACVAVSYPGFWEELARVTA